MIEAGAEVLETDTFQASRIKLEEWGLAEHTLEINRSAAEIARKAAGEEPLRGRLDRPHRPPAGVRRPDAGPDHLPRAARGLRRAGAGPVEGGADLLIIETAQDILEVKASIFGAREAFKRTGRSVPIQASVSLLPQGGKMLLGTDIAAALTTLEALKVDAVGLNCSTGPEDMRDAIRYLGEFATVPVHCIPNAGLPLQGPDGETIFPESPEQLSTILGEFVERYGVSIVGGCCGTTPEHIAAIHERCADHDLDARPPRRPPHVSSMMAATPLVQDPRPTLVGERVNSQGSRKAKELLLADDYDGLVQVAEDQVEGGAHVLDVCVALTERQDEAEQMRQVVKRIALTQPAPIQVDSTEPDVIEIALEQIPGRAIVNSVNLEAGRDKLDRVAPRRAGPRREPDRADHRRGRDGQDGRPQGRDRPAHQGDGLRRARPGARGADLRLPDLHADHGRRGVAAERRRDDRGHPPHQDRDPRRADLAGRLERLLRRLAARARRPQLGLPAPLRRGRARPGDGQPEPHHALRRDPRQRARARRRPRVQPPRGRAGALHRPLRVQGRAGRGGRRRRDRGDGARGGAALPDPAPQARRRRGPDRPRRSRRSARSRR